MIIKNKYFKWYIKLIKNAKSRNFKNRKEANQVLGNVDLHHIIPKSIGGDNRKSNLIFLSIKEHYIAHRLLAKFTTSQDRIRMEFALWKMSCSKKLYNFTLRRSLFLSQIATMSWDDKFGIEIATSMKNNLSKKFKGQSYDDLYGKEKATILKSNQSLSRKGITWDDKLGSEKSKDLKNKVSKRFKEKSYIELYGEESAAILKNQRAKSSKKQG